MKNDSGRVLNQFDYLLLIEQLQKELISDDVDSAYIFYQLQNINNYYKGEFSELTNNKPFNRVINDFFELAFYGDSYLWYLPDKNLFKVLKNTGIKENGRIKFLEYKTNNYYLLNEDTVVKFNYGLGSLWLQWYMIFKQEKELFNIWKLNAYSDAKKFIRKINSDNETVIVEQNAKYFNTKTPFIDVPTVLSDSANGFENDLIELVKTASNTAISFNNIIDHFKLFADRLGYSVAQETKRERLTQAESLINTHNTNNLMEIPRRNLRVLSESVKEKWNIVLEFERVEEILTNEFNDGVEKNTNENN